MVIKVLEKLEGHWDMASDLLVIVKSSFCTDELLNSLISLVNKAIKTAKKDEEKSVLLNNLYFPQIIEQTEFVV